MNKKKTIVLLVIAILVVTTMSIGVTYSYMKNKTSGNTETEIGINNCAKITLKDNDSTINLTNMYPMEEEMGLQTTPYEFTVSSTCEEYTGFNLYLTTLTDNEIEDSLIRYAVTDVNDNVLITDLLTNKTEEIGLTEEEITELENGLDNKRKNTYKVFNNNLYIKEEKTYKLHLWLDENANNDTMNQSFKIKVSIKGYDWDGTITNYLIANRNNTLLYHNGTIKDMDGNIIDAEDFSYRYAGPNYKITINHEQEYNEIDYTLIKRKCDGKDQTPDEWCDIDRQTMYYYLNYKPEKHFDTYYYAILQAIDDGYIEPNMNNYVCFGGECSNNPNEEEKYSNLYRIIGIFPTTETKDLSSKTYQLKIIKADYTTTDETGGTGIGAFASLIRPSRIVMYKGTKAYLNKIAIYYWNRQQNGSGNDTNDWGQSNLNTENLIKTFLNYIKNKENEKWYNMIEEDHTWITLGNTYNNIANQNAKNAYENEIKSPNKGSYTAAETYSARVGLMYVSDYMYGVDKKFWNTKGKDYSSIASNDWLYMGLWEWPITRVADRLDAAFRISIYGGVADSYVNKDSGYNYDSVRPCFYLNSSVKIVSGNGTSSDPYIIDM